MSDTNVEQEQPCTNSSNNIPDETIVEPKPVHVTVPDEDYPLDEYDLDVCFLL